MKKWLIVALVVVVGISVAVAKAMAGSTCPLFPDCPC